jgi:3-hydroxyacyl-CoA dehydrogenase/enoyl-CoA hydratase/3-hydroxybutyryl-CoA epimerase
MMIAYDVDADGIATLTWDMPGRSTNVLNEESIEAFGAAVQRLADDESAKGAVIASAKPDFVVGGDLEMLYVATYGTAADFYRVVRRLQLILRQLETLGKPVVAALGGSALGGGLEIALACHHRIAADNAKARFGLPEVTLGLLPGGGGTQRLPRLIGIAASLKLLTTGRTLDVAQAKEQGIVDAIAPADTLLPCARSWLREHGEAVQPWDRKGFALPGGATTSLANMTTIGIATAGAHARAHENLPAPRAILASVFEGTIVDIDAGLDIEAKYMTRLVTGPDRVARNMIRTGFLNLGRANKLARRPEGIVEARFAKVGVIGAGMMGAGIAWRAALAGLSVVLIDATQDAADGGKAHAQTLAGRAVARRAMTAADAEALLERILSTTDYAPLADVDLVIEAVFEDRAVKQAVIEKVENIVRDDVIVASNTSTLPITSLAAYSTRPANFIGLHYFSPVDRMPLVEVILGTETSSETLAHALDFVAATKMTPIVVNDARGFYTSRVFRTYILEALAMVEEGVPPAMIEHAGRAAGMPMPPLALLDDVSSGLMMAILKQERTDLGDAYVPFAGEAVGEFLVAEGRLGRKAGNGCYDYDAPGGERKRLWSGLEQRFGRRGAAPELQQLKDRLLLRQAFEAVRCVEEGVITDHSDADVGALLGWGFAPWAGGPLSYVDTLGADAAIEKAKSLAISLTNGGRFEPPALLTRMAHEKATFYGQIQ